MIVKIYLFELFDQLNYGMIVKHHLFELEDRNHDCVGNTAALPV